MYANVKVVGRGVISLRGKSPRWVIVWGVIVQGVNGMGVKVLWGKYPGGGKRQGDNVRGVNGGGYKS